MIRFLSFIVTLMMVSAQHPQVSMLVKNINAAGGVTMGPDGYVYVSDFGPTLGNPTDTTTSVYRVNPTTGKWTVFASGFEGASGACFDSEGNFYQSNIRSGTISKVTPSGKVIHEWATGLELPVGIVQGKDGHIYVTNCRSHKISKIDRNTQKRDSIC